MAAAASPLPPPDFFNTSVSFFFFVLATVLFSAASVPSVCSLSTVAISESFNQTIICALRQRSNQESFLSCSGFPDAGIQIPALNSNFSYYGVVAGDGFVCALSSLSSPSNSTMVCWRFSANSTQLEYKRIYEGSYIRELEAGSSHCCGLVNDTDRLLCWPWQEFNNTRAQNLTFASIAVGEDFVCGLSETGRVSCFGNNSRVLEQAPVWNYRMIAAGFRHACVLNLDNYLHCWGDIDGQNTPNGRFKLLALGENRSCGLLANDTVVCWGQNNFSLPQNLQNNTFVNIEAKRSVFCGVLNYDFSLICWGNQAFDSNSMVFDEVLPGPCRSVCPCGILPGSGIYCSRGNICEHCYTNTVTLTPASSGWSDKMIASVVVGCGGCSALLLALGF